MSTWEERMDALMDKVREKERRESAAAKLGVRAWARRLSGTYHFDDWREVESDGNSLRIANDCLLARIPGTLLTVLNARKFHPGSTRRIRDHIEEELRRREILYLAVVPPYPMTTYNAEDLARAWEVHVDRSAPDYFDRVRGFARYIVDAWLAERNDHIWYGWVEYSAFAGRISVQSDCIVTRGEPSTIALVSAKKFPKGKEKQIFRDEVRAYLQALKIPLRDLTVKNHGGYVRESDLASAWKRERPRLIGSK